MNEELNKIGEGLGLENVVVEDGVMKITPADAGIHLFGSLQLLNSELEEKENLIDKLYDGIEKTIDDRDKYISFLETVLESIEGDDKYKEMYNMLMNIMYPVSGVTSEGIEVPFNVYKEEI
jgi:hypothetical protein